MPEGQAVVKSQPLSVKRGRGQQVHNVGPWGSVTLVYLPKVFPRRKF